MKKFLAVLLVAASMALAAGTAKAGSLTCGGAPPNLTVPTLSPTGTKTVGTILTLTRGSWQTGGCATTYTYFLYHNGVQFTSGAMNSSSIAYTTQNTDRGYTVTGAVQACQSDCSTVSATGSTFISCTGAPINSSAPVLSPTGDQKINQGTNSVLTLTRGTWQAGNCSPTYTYYLYRNGIQFQTGSMSSTSIQYSLTDVDRGTTITGAVQGCISSCGTASATGSATVRDITYSIWLDGVNKNINWQIKSPTFVNGLVEAQPRNGICEEFDAGFSNYNLGLATGTSSTVSLNQGMSTTGYNPLGLNGGEDGNGSSYPDATVSLGTTAWRSTMWTPNVSCPHGFPGGTFPGIGETAYITGGYAPVSLYGQITDYGTLLHGGNNEILLQQYWLLGNYGLVQGGTGSNMRDWIEVGTIVSAGGDPHGCGAPINNGSVYFYVEELQNSNSTSFANGSCTTSWNGSMSHWHNSDGTYDFYIFGPASAYGTTHTFELRYVSG